MTPQQVNQVQTSFNKIIPIADPAAALFYGRLFAMAPETRALFRGDMHRQGRKLMSAIATVVNGLGDFEAIAPVACDLAKRHVSYGVTPEHYAFVGSALLWTLEQGLADEFTPALRAAWEAAYTALSEVMIASAYPGSQQASCIGGACSGMQAAFRPVESVRSSREQSRGEVRNLA